jgi:hypothetical protein
VALGDAPFIGASLEPVNVPQPRSHERSRPLVVIPGGVMSRDVASVSALSPSTSINVVPAKWRPGEPAQRRRSPEVVDDVVEPALEERSVVRLSVGEEAGPDEVKVRAVDAAVVALDDSSISSRSLILPIFMPDSG